MPSNLHTILTCPRQNKAIAVGKILVGNAALEEADIVMGTINSTTRVEPVSARGRRLQGSSLNSTNSCQNGSPDCLAVSIYASGCITSDGKPQQSIDFMLAANKCVHEVIQGKLTGNTLKARRDILRLNHTLRTHIVAPQQGSHCQPCSAAPLPIAMPLLARYNI